MASNTIHKQVFKIRDLTTRSVTLFPTQAQIIRDIKGISLQSGANQIVIQGLAPTVDEPSIKVEGTGSATITEVSVDLLPNKDVYEDIYPSDDEDESDSSTEESDVEIEALTALNKKIKNLQKSLQNENEKISSGSHRLRICDNFGQSVEKERPPPGELEGLLAVYQEERAKIHREHQESSAAADDIRDQIRSAEKEKTKVAKAVVKSNERKEKEKAKIQAKKLRAKAEVVKEKARVRAERQRFWPKKVYSITIKMETTSSDTPASSRRTSIDGDTVVNLATSDFHEPTKTPLQDGEISLSISYVTYSASWQPRYDLSLNTVKCTGSLDYGAELKNTTSEVWDSTKVILSTSQTTFSGLSETIPFMHPWHVKLIKGKGSDGALFSQRELRAKRTEYSSKQGTTQKPRYELFGYEAPVTKSKAKASRNDQVEDVLKNHSVPVTQSFGGFGSTNPFGAVQGGGLFGGGRAGGLFGSSVAPGGHGSAPGPTGSLFASSAAAGYGAASGPAGEPPTNGSFSFGNAAVSQRQGEVHSNAWAPQASRARHTKDHVASSEEDSDEDMGFGNLDDEPKPLVFEEGAWEESGMTTTYDVPGLKTLAPSNSTIKHKIAKVEFKNVIFSYIVIGKLRQVAFLKARMRNSSQISLLKGPLGLTLDGSFLGQASFPRVSSGESFSLPLGVDPAVNISYPKPTVKRAQSGIFSKEDSNVFTRTTIITNTKNNGPIQLTVLDQIPVSEEERLKLEIINPRGLKVGGDGIRTGQSVNAIPTNAGTAGSIRASAYGADGSSGANNKWGSAVATTKKGGEVMWAVKLNPGQAVKLLLEYESTFPSGESVVGVE